MVRSSLYGCPGRIGHKITHNFQPTPSTPRRTGEQQDLFARCIELGFNFWRKLRTWFSRDGQVTQTATNIGFQTTLRNNYGFAIYMPVFQTNHGPYFPSILRYPGLQLHRTMQCRRSNHCNLQTTKTKSLNFIWLWRSCTNQFTVKRKATEPDRNTDDYPKFRWWWPD